MQTDIGKIEQVQHLMDRTIQTYGRIDVLHNNAFRLYAGDRDFTNSTLEGWTGAIETNLLGHMLCCRYAIPHMIRAGQRVHHQHGLDGRAWRWRPERRLCRLEGGAAQP